MTPLSPPPASLDDLRALALQTHRELVQQLQHPLCRHLNHQMGQDQFWEALLEVTRDLNREQIKP